MRIRLYADSTSTEFLYNGYSQRVGIIEKNDLGTEQSNTRLLWEPGANEILQRRDGNTNAVRKNYFAQGFVDHTGGGAATSYYYTRDHLGSIREVTESTGTVVSRYDYSLWGERTLTSGTDLADFAFTGHYYHKPSHLHLTWFRAYDASLGRWLSRDPLGMVDGPNLYAYVGNNPLNSIDPLGLEGLGLADPKYDAFFEGANNALNGFVDALTFDATSGLRKLAGTDDTVDKCSAAYKGGEIAGITAGLATGGAGASKALAKAGSKSLRKRLYEIGQKTLPKKKYDYYHGRNADPVRRGIDIVRQEGWLKASTPSLRGLFSQSHKTVPTGLTPLAASGATDAAQAGLGLGAAANATARNLTRDCD